MYKTIFLIILSVSSFGSITHKEMLVNKYYIFEKLKNIYGEESVKYIKKYILAETKSFGGSCDPYNHEKGKSKEYGMEYECFKGLASLRGGDYSSPSVPRELFMEKACQAITQDKVIQKRFIKSKISYDLFNQHHKLYLPKKNLDKSVFDYIKKLPTDTRQKWRVFSKVMCRSLEWQKI